MRAVVAAARAAITRRRLQTVIVGIVVMLSSATAVLAVSLIVESHGPFDAAFAAARGAHMTVTVSPDATADRLAATSRAAGVEAAAGPFDVVTAELTAPGGFVVGEIVVAGRGEAGGPVDQLSLDTGTWLSGPGQVVLDRRHAGPSGVVGRNITLGGVRLQVVGVATSVTGTAEAWVWPTQRDVLDGESAARQMLYRFTSAATAEELTQATAAVTAGLPVTATTSYLTVRVAVNRSISAFVPFVVAFAILGIVLSILITTNVVNGAVVSGFRTIGVLKTLGYTPGQVVAVYVAQVVGPALVGALIGAPLGIGLALPLLAQTDRAFDLPAKDVVVAVWVVVMVLVAAPVLVALAAVGPATRAGRLAANQAITLGRAPRAGRGLWLRRALAASPLPRPVALGLGLPLSRPSRSVGTVVALLLGSVTLVFAVGLAASLDRIHGAFTRSEAVPVRVGLVVPGAGGPVFGPGPGPVGGLDPSAIPSPATVAAQVASTPGTQRSVLARVGSARAGGISQDLTLRGYEGDASWTGHALISGRWYAAAGEVVASSYLLRQHSLAVGDPLTLSEGRVLTIVGEFLDGDDDDLTVIGDAPLVQQARFAELEVALTPGTSASSYVESLQQKYPQGTGVRVENRVDNAGQETFAILDALIATLTLLLCGVAALGVLNTVVLTTRERIHDIGVLKALGMTPRQTRAMVITSMVTFGVVAGVLAVPLGVSLQRYILPVMASAAGTGLPSSIVDVYGTGQLLLLGSVGVALAVLGALLPAGWAARTRVATALRAE